MLLTSLGDRSFAVLLSALWREGIGDAGGLLAPVPRCRGCRFTRPLRVRSWAACADIASVYAELDDAPFVGASVRSGVYGAVSVSAALELDRLLSAWSASSCSVGHRWVCEPTGCAADDRPGAGILPGTGIRCVAADDDTGPVETLAGTGTGVC